MFEQSILKGAPRTRRVGSAMAAFAIQMVAIGGAFLFPLVFVEKMPVVRLAPPLPPAPRPMRAQVDPDKYVRVVDVVQVARPGVLVQPFHIPDHVSTTADPPLPPEIGPAGGVVGGVGLPGGSDTGVIGGIVQAMGRVRLTEAPPVKIQATGAQEKPPDRVKIGGVVMAGKLIHRVTPEYPPLAKLAHVCGTVRLQAIISRDGRIQGLQVLGGHALLVQAAVDAVAQWIYQPTTLNGDVVEVLTTIDVNFTLR
ncbi:MAG: energy transducer TonB [Bryobacteraceae bacterium]